MALNFSSRRWHERLFAYTIKKGFDRFSDEQKTKAG
jgi:hypothetical protein